MKKIIGLLVITILLASCKKGGDGGSNDGSGNNGATPAAATLTAPLKDEICTTGTDITDSTSSINFTWQSARNASSYELSIKNLSTQAVVTKTVQTTQTDMTLLKNAPYSWFVTSKSTKSKTTTESEVWKFYNGGNGIVTYAPYPAEVTAPLLGQHITSTNGKIKLSWKGSVAGGSIVGYNVYFGPSSSPPVFRTNIKDNFIDNVTVSSNTTYYWYIVTVDSNNNTSNSGIYNFFVGH